MYIHILSYVHIQKIINIYKYVFLLYHHQLLKCPFCILSESIRLSTSGLQLMSDLQSFDIQNASCANVPFRQPLTTSPFCANCWACFLGQETFGARFFQEFFLQILAFDLENS